MLLRALGPQTHRALLMVLMVGLFGLAGGQTAWQLRPFLGRPS
ncbi:MAG: hypothetical protein OEZ06_02865 [Myxococcales bacterium]|nr:hypothetical protein [Myxococcales bacterium]